MTAIRMNIGALIVLSPALILFTRVEAQASRNAIASNFEVRDDVVRFKHLGRPPQSTTPPAPDNRRNPYPHGPTSTTSSGPDDTCYGACCHVFDETCTEDSFVYECQSEGGFFFPATTCADSPCNPNGDFTGACCFYDSGFCAETLSAECPPFPDAVWTFGATCDSVFCAPVPIGACCEENFGTCTDGVNLIECLLGSLLGVFTPDASCADVSCPSVGACCNSFTAECTSDSTLVDCFNSGADFITLNSSCEEIECPEVGLCCNPDGSCSDDVSAFDCLNGLWDPSLHCGDLECPVVELGACCSDLVGFCLEPVDEILCVFGFGGAWFNAQSCADVNDCTHTGACCAGPFGPCADDTLRDDCESALGVWYDNLSCDSVSCDLESSCGGVNASLETGTFHGWMAADMAAPYYPLSVGVAGVSTYPCFFFSSPTDGQFAVLHGWDGVGPDTIRLSHDFTPPSDVTVVKYDYRAAWLLTFGAFLDRTFEVTVLLPGDVPVWGPELILTATANGIQGDTGSLTHALDISPWAGEPVRLHFEWLVPEPFTGPAQFQLDNLRCESPSLSPASHAAFVECLTGPAGNQPGKSCSPETFSQADALTDGRVDLRDFRVLVLQFSP